ncbi:MAG: glycoside hydrolase family 5 protein [Treponema sp.]|nr:glycoside hydrolase family 5 protein [Treponema sp.]
MKNISRIFLPIILVGLLAITGCGNPKISIEAKAAELSKGFGQEVAEAFEFTLSMRIGWNLGNSLDAHQHLTPNEVVWGNPRVTQELMNGVAAQGFGAVRIPVTWGNTINDRDNFSISERWMDRVEEVVGYVLNAGMKAIINIHHDGADSYFWLSVKNTDIVDPNKSAIDEKFTAVWRQIAQRFRDYDNRLIFEGFNELHDGSWGNGNAAQHNRVNELNQIFVDTVRAAGGENSNRYLLIHGWVTRPSVTVSSLVMPTDTVKSRIIVGIHFYDPFDFTLGASQNKWGDKSNFGGWGNEPHIQREFRMVREAFVDKGIPIIIGEYGAGNQAQDRFVYRKYYMEYVTKAAFDNGFVCFYWDNGGFGAGREKSGLLKRSDGTTHDSAAAEILAVMMKAVNEDYLISSIAAP